MLSIETMSSMNRFDAGAVLDQMGTMVDTLKDFVKLLNLMRIYHSDPLYSREAVASIRQTMKSHPKS